METKHYKPWRKQIWDAEMKNVNIDAWPDQETKMKMKTKNEERNETKRNETKRNEAALAWTKR